MIRVGLYIILLGVVVSGCAQVGDGARIVKIVDFEISPDEDKVAFSALTPVGNTDIWVVDIDGSNLKKLTFKDRSPSNHIARFFKKHKWRNFFRVDMHSPGWTKDRRIAFCEEITKHHTRGINTVAIRRLTIRPDGSDKKIKTDKDKITQRRPFDPINRPEVSDYSKKHETKIFLRDNTLWVLKNGETNPKKLIP
ncbi:MAG: hypothetical protein KKG01_04355 [Candidatus Omnitrophica bacterium]|nr:hypothetical protein [Candidatus Omnitrophota bacterium]